MSSPNNGKLHEGHRERLRKRFCNSGLDDFEPHEVLELLLFHTIPRSNVNEHGHNLINRFGSLNNVISADIGELGTVKGIGSQSAVFLSFIKEFHKYIAKHEKENSIIISDTETAVGYLYGIRQKLKPGILYAAVIDDNKRLIKIESIGDLMETDPKTLRMTADDLIYRTHANSFVLFRRNDGDMVHPRHHDLISCNNMRNAYMASQFCLLDYVILGEHNWYSMIERREGEMNNESR